MGIYSTLTKTAGENYIERLTRITEYVKEKDLSGIEEIKVNVGLLYAKYDSAFVRYSVEGKVLVFRAWFSDWDGSVVYEDDVPLTVYADSCHAESLMRSHDWYYQMSDDHRVWKRGREAESKMRAVLERLPKEEKDRLWQKHAPNQSS